MSFYLGVAQVDEASNVSMFEWLAQKSGENILPFIKYISSRLK